jgi:ariadne-1
MFILGFLTHKSLALEPQTKDNLKMFQILQETKLMPKSLENFFIALLIENSAIIESLIYIFYETQNPDLVLESISEADLSLYNQIDIFLNKNRTNDLDAPLPIMKSQPRPLETFIDLTKFTCGNLDTLPCPVENFDQNELFSLINIENQGPFAKHTCLICYENISIYEYFPLLSCCDKYHADCINKYLVSEVDGQKLPIKCPNCQVNFLESDILERLDADYRKKYYEASVKAVATMNPEVYSCCPTPGCSYIFEPSGQTSFTCPCCRKYYCLRCRVEFHSEYTCDEYHKYFLNKTLDEQEFFKTALGKKFKECPSCHFWVERTTGCNHMTCRCRYEFCYNCGGKYGTCSCGFFTRKT